MAAAAAMATMTRDRKTLYTTAEAAAALGVSRQMVAYLVRTKRLHAWREAGSSRLYLSRREVDRLARARAKGKEKVRLDNPATAPVQNEGSS